MRKKGATVIYNKERVKIKGSSSGKGREERRTDQLGMAPPAVRQRFCPEGWEPQPWLRSAERVVSGPSSLPALI